jgi:putative ABC transport system permease protein
MSLWRHLSRGFRALVRRDAAERELRDELDHYLEEAAAAHRSRGLSPAEARRAARLELGSETGVAEQVRAYGWENLVSTTVADLRYGARRLCRDAAFTLLAAITLALGIGATTAIFSAVHPILLQPLPYPDAGRVTALWEIAGDGSRLAGTYATYRALAERSRSFAVLAVSRPWQPALVGGAEPELLTGQRVSAGYFHVLGITPALGRGFTAADDQPGAPLVVVLSHELWQRRFGADPAILGRAVRLDDDNHLVVGVMPRGFENALAPATTIWRPLCYDLSLPQAFGHHLRTLGRLRPGVDPQQATRELAALVPSLQRDLPAAHVADRLVVTSLQDDVTREVRPALLAIAGAVVVLLAIACVNVTHLLVARGARRRGELALRAALGAGRARILRQMLAESLLLALFGGALGVGVGVAGTRALIAASPAGLPRVGAIGVDPTVLGFALAVTTLVGLLCGLAPALRAARRDLEPALRQASRRTTGGRSPRGRLVIAEVALAVVLLMGTGLLLRSLQRLLEVPLGFSPTGVLSLQVQAAGHRFADDAVTRAFFGEALAAVRRLPGVAAAAWTSQLPLSGDENGFDDSFGLHFEADAPQAGQGVLRYAVSPAYFTTVRVPARSGRLLDDRDRAGAPPAALLNESFARRRFGDADPVGQRLRIGPQESPWFTVVGVVGDVRQASLAASPEDAVYVTTDQWHWADRALWLVVRTGGDPGALATSIQRAIWSIDPDQPIVRVATMESRVAASAAQRRFTMALFAAFAAVALSLAATGVYGVLATSVAERRREIGMRCAMGASRRGILAEVLGQGMRLTAAGALLGLAAAALASDVLASLLFDVSRLDPLTHGAVVVLLVAVAAAASAVPAWRASRVDPAITLRAE